MRSQMIEAAGHRLHALEAGQGPLVLMVHGFPGLAYSWRHQMAPLAEAGYRAVAIDSLGYGRSDRPLAARAYAADCMQAMLLGVLDHYGAESAVIIGQDFGAQYAWNLAVRAAPRVRGLIATIPYDYDLAGRAMLGRAPRLPPGAAPEAVAASPDHLPSARFAAMAAQHFVHFHYFQNPGPAERELGLNARAYLQRLFHALSAAGDLWAWKQRPSAGTGYLDVLPDAPPLPWPWLSEAEFAVFVEAYSQGDLPTRFIGGLNAYRTADENWRQGEVWADADVSVPTLFLYGAKDPSFAFFPAWEERLRRRVPGLRGIEALPGAGHLLQQEDPGGFNRAMLDFLAALR